MTQEWINKHQAPNPFELSRKIDKKMAKLERKRSKAFQNYWDRQNKCDHLYPDGSISTDQTGCRICGLSVY